MQLDFGGRRYPVAAGDVVIGSGSDSTLVLAAPGVLPRHAVIRPLGSGMAVVIPALPGAEILVNGARLGSDPTPVSHGDTIRIGGCEITVIDPRRAGATSVLAAAPPASTSDSPASTTHDTSPSGSRTASGRLVSLSDGREYSLGIVPFVIGRDARSAVLIEADEVSLRHAEVLGVPEGDCLVDLSSGGVWVNGERVRGKTILKSGDVIRVAAEELRYYPAEAGAPAGANFRLGDTVVGLQAIRRPPMIQAAYLAPSEPPLASLLIRSGRRQGERIEVRTPVVNVGRADYNDVSLPDPSVSASHARLQLREGVWMLADLGSTNGTRMNGDPVTGETAISSGSTVTFGEVTVTFEPRDTGVSRGSDTRVLQVPLADSAPVGPGPQGSVVGGLRRNPAPGPSAGRMSLIVLGVGVVFLVIAYFLLG
jgi:pSer/pThr/pTyr-binding forkhead associated (FHA) protein